jgi:hypothetical protein
MGWGEGGWEGEAGETGPGGVEAPAEPGGAGEGVSGFAGPRSAVDEEEGAEEGEEDAYADEMGKEEVWSVQESGDAQKGEEGRGWEWRGWEVGKECVDCREV